MTDESEQNAGDNVSYREREAVAIFDNERSLNAAVDELMLAGLREDDLSVLADAAKLSLTRSASDLADKDGAPRAVYVSPDARTEGLAALAGGPALLGGLTAALVAGTGGAALIPTIAVTVGSTLAGGGIGLVLARVFGRKHASYVGQQLMKGGLLLWVHAPDETEDAKILEILERHGGREVHFHVAHRTWGLADRPMHDVNPDPFLRGR
ncbi:MAG: hypothetical protein GEV13_07700 [Rhodospirillales bacterium]|nr:hypothetical protein [Rhodospirillales bacterium]